MGTSNSDGYGVVAAVEFIVEDELTGLFRASEGEVNPSFQLNLNHIISVNQTGHFLSHPNYSQEINFKNQSIDQDETESSLDLIIYPNPTNSWLNIESTSEKISLIEIFDGSGRLMLTQAPDNPTHSLLDFSSFSDGIYFVRVSSSQNIKTHKISKVTSH